MSVTGAVRAAGLPTGGDDSRPTPVLDGVVKTYRPARVLVVEPVRRDVHRGGLCEQCLTPPGRTPLCTGGRRLVARRIAAHRHRHTCPSVCTSPPPLLSYHLLPNSRPCFSHVTSPSLALPSIHGSTGELHPYTGARGHDVFASEGDALEALYAEGRIAATLSGKAVLGLAALPAAGVALLLLATRVRVSVTLPGGHDVNSVSEAVWVKIPLRAQGSGGDGDAAAPGSEVLPGGSAGGGSPRPSDNGEASTHTAAPNAAAAAAAGALVTALLEYPVEGCHLYCHTADVTRPWPWGGPHGSRGSEAPQEPDAEFTWNRWLAQPFAAAGCASACPPLVQGLAECRLMVDAKGVKACVALLSRRSRLHPGTRYLARGLNDAASPGNEVECEQLLFRVGDPLGAAAMQSLSLADTSGGAAASQQQQRRVSVQQEQVQQAQAWCSVVWRRGTVPIRWGTELKSSVGEAELYVSARDPYNGTAQYFARLCDTYTSRRRSSSAAAAADSDGAQPPDVPSTPGSSGDAPGFTVTCVNLLRSSLKAPELLLTEHFQEGVRAARKQQPRQLGGLRVLNFDWHGNIKALGEVAAVEGLWTQLHAACVAAGLSVGADCARASGAVPGSDVNTGQPGREVTTWQRGMLRYNCADSLDRTNLASFFGAVQLVIEQAAVLGLCFEQPAAGSNGTQASAAQGLARAASQQQAVLAVMPGRRVTPGVVSLWAQQQATGRVNTVPDMPGVQSSSSVGALPVAAPVNGHAAQSGLPPGWESRTDAVRGFPVSVCCLAQAPRLLTLASRLCLWTGHGADILH